MAKSFWKVVNQIIRESDIVLEVLDARFIEETRNEEIEFKCQQLGKKVIYVINKSDLVSKNELTDAKKSLNPCVFMSAKLHQGTSILRTMILKIGDKPQIKVGVLGYPNTGKSSLINALKGKKSARTSPLSGFTKGMQWIRINPRILMIDSPGVVPFGEKHELKHVLIATTDYSSVKEPDLLAMDLIKIYKGRIERHYGVNPGKNAQQTLEEIALKHRKLMKGGLPDAETMARIIIKDWQAGKIKKAGKIKN
ncbi:50S ribosome-binding GTPase [Candidatus Woesearchaeota archaeon]|nr:50S ribosome-binding GTPase [Candidatus Woesearchaeota archaeon]